MLRNCRNPNVDVVVFVTPIYESERDCKRANTDAKKEGDDAKERGL